MNTKHKIILAFFGVLWLALGVTVLAGRGVNLYNLLIVAMSGVIVFVPLWKKYNRHDS